MKKIRLFAFLIAFLQALSLLPVSAFAIENSEVLDNSVDLSLSYLSKKQYEDGTWGEIGKIQTDDINQILEYMYYTDYESDIIVRMLDKTSDYFYILDVLNNENLSQFLLIDDIRDEDAIICLYNSQNSDGGFGLAEGYTSDIIDTKLALKALTDIGETEAMTNAALYISSLQNEDGGFGYQQGLSSNAYLTADIANILVDTIDVNPILSYYLEDTFTALDSYLDSTFPALNELSSSDLDTVYQHFHTALYRLKRDGRYDVTPYYALQAEDGGVFDDPMATALYLELLVREQNALVAKIDNIAITNDRGYAVSAFNSNENSDECCVVLGSFTPDTSERNAYIIKAELMSNDIQIAQTTTNYFVSDKSVAIAYNTDKDYLTEIDDNANVTISLRDERVVDLIFTTSSEDTELINKHAAQIETIKDKLEKMGYAVNLSNVSTSYLSAKDTFAWIEYDHPNYNTQTPYTQHIVYDDNNIKMLGYTAVAYKDFLLVPDENSSQKIFNFDIQRDKTDWHSMNGGGFLFNTTVEEETISGYYVLVTSGGLRLYRLDNVNLKNFRNSSTTGTLMQTFTFSNLYDEHHIKIVADSNYISLWDDDNLIIDNYELPAIYGNGYGSITSHASHNCSQRSYFTFANITMQTITGEKLLDVLDNYNFESDNSRYVISLSDSRIDGLDDEEALNNVAQKIEEKNITFVGLGNDESSEQYQHIVDLISDNAYFYQYSDRTAMNTIQNFIIDTEEEKRVLNSEAVIATNLTITGELPDGSAFAEHFDVLHEGETISFAVPVELSNLTSGIDAVLLKNIKLDYTDENNNARIKTLDKITLPVIGSDGKIINHVSTDKLSYYEYEDVNIFDRIHNNSDIRAAKGLISIINVLDPNGNVIAEYRKPLSEVMTKSFEERTEVWNVADQPEGQYTIVSYVYDGEILVAESQAIIEVLSHELPQYELTGSLSASGKLFKADETIGITRYLKNIGRYDIENGTVSIKIIDVAHENVVYEREEILNLLMGENNNSSFSVVPANDFTSRKGKEYIITYEVMTEDGQTIELPGDEFILDGFNLEFLGDDVLFSMNDDSSIKGIQMSGWLMNVFGSMHSNSDIEANCATITVNGECSSVLGCQFNTGQNVLNSDPVLSEFIEFPDILSAIKQRLQATELLIENGWTSENDSEFRIYGNRVTARSDIFSSKSLVIDPSDCFATAKDEGIIICSEGDITIRSTDVDIKGVIYAPNGTVKIESNNFNIHGRIIAKNIVFQGSIFTGETYDGDLNLFN